MLARRAHAHTRRQRDAHVRGKHTSVFRGSGLLLLAHGMDDQKRPTAADHYANDTLSKSPESAGDMTAIRAGK